MSQRRGTPRCPQCRINVPLCICSSLQPFNIQTAVSLIVHVRELKLTSNSAQFIQLMLPQNAQTFIRGKVFEDFTPSEILNRPGRPLFLYPHEDAIELNEDFLKDYPGPYHLIVPDGNWHQARKVRKREEAFREMMAVKLPAGITAEYQLRKAPQPEWVSTYESVAHSLGVLEGDVVRNQLMLFFRSWVQRTLWNRAGNQKV
jgi:DTW domain-containing protein